MAYTNPDPPRYAYEPRRARLSRERQEFEALTSRVSDLAFSGDPLGIAKGQQLLEAYQGQGKVTAARDARRQTVQARTRELLDQKLRERGRGVSIIGGGLAGAGAAGALAAGLMDDDVRSAVGTAVRKALAGYDRVRQGSLGFFTGDNPVESVQQAYKGVTGQERYRGEDVGFVRHLPEGSTARKLGGVVGEEITDPLTIASAVVGGPAVSGALKSAGPVGRAVEGVLSPALRGSIARRYAGEVAINLGARGVSEGARAGVEAAGGGETAQTVASVAGGLAGGVTTAVGLQAAIRGARAAGAGASRAASAAADRLAPIGRELVAGETGSIRFNGGYRFEPDDVPGVLEELARFKPTDDVTRNAIKDLQDIAAVNGLTGRSARLSDAIDQVYFRTAWDAEGNQLTLPRGKARPFRPGTSPQQRATAKASAEGAKIGEERLSQARMLIEQDPSLAGMVQAGPEGVRAPNDLEAARARMRKVHGREVDEYLRADAPDERALDRAAFQAKNASQVAARENKTLKVLSQEEAVAQVQELRRQYQADRALVEGPSTSGLEPAGPEGRPAAPGEWVEPRTTGPANVSQLESLYTKAHRIMEGRKTPSATKSVDRLHQQMEPLFQAEIDAAAARVRRPAWQLTSRLYQSEAGIAQPHIMEIGPDQIRRQSAGQAARYQGKRSVEWTLSERIKDRYAQDIRDAFERGEFTLEDPNLHPEARDVLLAGQRRDATASAKAAADERMATNRITEETDLAVGDRVYDLMRSRYGTVERVNRKSVRLSYEDGTKGGTVEKGALQWLDYNTAKARAEAGEQLTPAGTLEALPEEELARPQAQQFAGDAERPLLERADALLERFRPVKGTDDREGIVRATEGLSDDELRQMEATLAAAVEPAKQARENLGGGIAGMQPAGPTTGGKIRGGPNGAASRRITAAAQRLIDIEGARNVIKARLAMGDEGVAAVRQATADAATERTAAREARRQAHRDIRIAGPDDVKVGDRVWWNERGEWATVTKVNKATLRARTDAGLDLEPRRYTDGAFIKRPLEEAIADVRASADNVDKYADEAFGPETETGGQDPYGGYPKETGPYNTHVQPKNVQRNAQGTITRAEHLIARLEELPEPKTWAELRRGAMKLANESGEHYSLLSTKPPRGPRVSSQMYYLDGLSGGGRFLPRGATPADSHRAILEAAQRKLEDDLDRYRYYRSDDPADVPFLASRGITSPEVDDFAGAEAARAARRQRREGVQAPAPDVADEVAAQRVGMPQDLRQDVQLLADNQAWQQSVTTPGARVRGVATDGQPFEGTVIRSDTLPSGVGRVLVEHEFEGQPAQRFYAATQLEAADATQAASAMPVANQVASEPSVPLAPRLLEAGTTPAQLPAGSNRALVPAPAGNNAVVPPAAPPGAGGGGGAGAPPAPPGGVAAPPGPPGGGASAAPPPPGHAPLGNSAAREALARENRVLHRPGRAGQAALKNPIVREGALVLNPSLDMDRQVYVAYNAKNDVRAQLATRLRIDENLLLDDVEKAWDADTPRYIGDPDWPAAGTITDFMWNPGRYEGGSPALRQALEQLDAYRTAAIDELRAGYGVDVEARASAVDGALYQPTVAFNEERLAALDRTVETLSGSGRAKTRVWDDPYERWLAAKARGEDLQFVTDHRMLTDMHAEAFAKMAGDSTFKMGTGGLTKAEVVDQVRPGLRQAREAFTQKVASLRARMETAMRQGGIAARDTRTLDSQMTRVERRAQPMLERVADLGNEYGPELSYLSGQLHELGLDWRHLRKSLLDRGVKVADIQARYAQLLAEFDVAVPELDQLRRAYEAVDTFPYVLNRQTFRYYPADVARQVDQVLGPPSTNGALRFADSWRNLTLNADMSIATIHGSLAAGMDPVTTYKTAGDMLRAARDPQMLERVYQSERAAVEDFVFSTGFDWPGRGVEYTGEFGRTPPLIERIPGFGKKLQAFNEGAWRAVTYRLYQQWKLDRELLKRWNPGLTDEMASSEAATTLWQLVPRMNPARSGRSLARTQLERTFLISPSFLGQPVVTMRDALSGMVKIGMDRAYGRGAGLRAATPREQLAMLRLGTLMGTATAISAASAIASAPFNEQSPAEALAEVLDPRSGRFLSLIIGNQGSVSLATPFRAVLRAMAPRRNEEGDWDWPLPGLVGYIKGKRAPWLSALWEQIQSEDYFGNPIDEGMFPWELANRAYFLAESALPIAAGEVMGGVRLGNEPGDIAKGVGAQLLGQSLYPRRPLEDLSRISRSRYGRDFFELERSQQQQLKETYPDLWRRFVATGKASRRDAEVARDIIRGQQAALDEALLQGQRGKDEWRDQRSKLRENLAGRLEQIYGDSGNKPLPADADALRRWGEQIRLNRGKDGIVDWNAVDAWERTLPQEDRDYIARNTGVDDTPVGRVYRKIAAVQDQVYELPKYRGYSADEAQQIDKLWQKARNGAKSAEQRDMLRAFAQLSDEERSSKAGRGVLSRIRGRLRRTRDRERFTKQHPELQLFFGQGPLSTQQREALTRLVEAETRSAERSAA